MPSDIKTAKKPTKKSQKQTKNANKSNQQQAKNVHVHDSNTVEQTENNNNNNANGPVSTVQRQNKKKTKNIKNIVQQTTKHANNTCRVTYLRNVAERAWGRLKQWTILRHTLPTRHGPNAKKMVLVLAAIANAYFPPLATDTQITEEYSKRILDGLKQTNNELKQVCNSGGWSSVQKGRNKYNSTVDFIKNTNIIPEYDKKDIIDLGMGKHGWKCSTRYIAHSFEKCEAMLQKNKNGRKHCIKFKNIVGRFQSTKTQTPKKYELCIEFDANKNTKLQNTKWYCRCKTGSRTTNPCAHVIAALRYCNLIKKNRINVVKSDYYQMYKASILDCYEYAKAKKRTGTYCKCKSADASKWHIECDLCKERYHPKCINIPKSTLQQFVVNDIAWWCPYCEEEEIDESEEDIDNDIANDIDIRAVGSNITMTDDDSTSDFEEPPQKRRKVGNGRSVSTQRQSNVSARRSRRPNNASNR